MKKLIAYCGLDCAKCDARIATLNNDNALREKVAVEITPEMINCEGCRMNGLKTPYCNSLCPIRQCALDKGCETCGNCSAINGCQTVGMIISNNEEALDNLKNNQ